MKKSLTSKLLAAATTVALASSMFLVPMQAQASGIKSLGHGVKCGWMLVSYDPVKGASVYTYVCSSGGA